MRDRITDELPGKDNKGLRAKVRALACEPNYGIGYQSPEALTQIIARQVALTPQGRVRVRAAFTALASDCYGMEGAA